MGPVNTNGIKKNQHTEILHWISGPAGEEFTFESRTKHDCECFHFTPSSLYR